MSGDLEHSLDDESGSPLRRASDQEKKLVGALTSALKVSKLHELTNVVCQDALNEFHDQLDAYLEGHAEVSVLLNEGLLYISGGMVPMPRHGHSWMNEFMEFMQRMGIAGLELRGSWSRERVQDILESFRAATSTDPQERFAEIEADLKARIAAPASIKIFDKVHQAGAASAEVSDAARATYYYARLVSLAQEAHASVREEGTPDVHERHVRQTLIKIVEFLDARVFALRLIAMTVSAPNREDPLATHAANVAVLSMAMGRLLGLGRAQIANLGFAALFHDIGRAEAGARFPDPPGAREDLLQATEHVTRGVRILLRSKTAGAANQLRLIVCQEHHRVADGYPEVQGLPPPHPFSRIVAVADTFDKLQNGTPWYKPRGPAEALEAILGDDRHDPAVTALMRDVLGRRPRGSIVRLRDTTLGVVLEGGASRGHCPLLRVLMDANGKRVEGLVLREVTDPDEVVLDVPAEAIAAVIDWRQAVTE